MENLTRIPLITIRSLIAITFFLSENLLGMKGPWRKLSCWIKLSSIINTTGRKILTGTLHCCAWRSLLLSVITYSQFVCPPRRLFKGEVACPYCMFSSFLQTAEQLTRMVFMGKAQFKIINPVRLLVNTREWTIWTLLQAYRDINYRQTTIILELLFMKSWVGTILGREILHSYEWIPICLLLVAGLKLHEVETIIWESST